MDPNENPASKAIAGPRPRPKVSVYMPVYNAEEYVGRAIESILEQTLEDFEFLIVDDGSTDGSAGVIESYRDSRIRLFRQENQGCYPARNAALREARGEYLANMDADDISLPERLEKQAAFLDRHPEVVLVGTRTYECDKDDTVRLPRPDFFKADEEGGILLPTEATQRSAPFTLPSIMFSRALVDRGLQFDERFFFAGDLDFVARAALSGRVACVSDYLYVLRCQPESISSRKANLQRKILKLLAQMADRRMRGEVELGPAEVDTLCKLKEVNARIPKANVRIKQFNYHNRLATLYRVNGKFKETLSHLLKAFCEAPTVAPFNRKFMSNLVRSLLFLLHKNGKNTADKQVI
jgi:glycosyltransferase involved in cell wall biosynthesis